MGSVHRSQAHVRHDPALPRRPPKLVQEPLGHATISITLDTYSHVLPGMDEGLAEAMGDALG
jgi:integrase